MKRAVSFIMAAILVVTALLVPVGSAPVNAAVAPYDANADGVTNIKDAMAILKHIAGWGDVIADLEAADCNGDGKITVKDVIVFLNRCELKISGVDILSYRIVYPAGCENGEDALAEKIAAHIYEKFAIALPVSDDSAEASEHEIIIGASSHATEEMKHSASALANYSVDLSNAMLVTLSGHLWVIAESTYSVETAVDRLIADTTPRGPADTVDVDYSAENALCVASEKLGEKLKIMSYNVKTGHDNDVAHRAPDVRDNILDFDADIIGMQEINWFWITELKKRKFNDTYSYVGEAREGTAAVASNEYSCIYYKTDKFNVIDSGTYWLSDTPNEISKHEASDYYRIMTFALFERKSDGFRFLHVNTHVEWDHDDVKTNLIQTNILLQLTDGILEKHGDLPVYFTGDFNMSPSSDGYARMLEWGNDDSRSLAENTTDECTIVGGSTLDYCFVSKGDFLVTDFEVGTDYPGSDHFPVVVSLYVLKNQ